MAKTAPVSNRQRSREVRDATPSRNRALGDEERDVEKLKYYHYRLHRVDAEHMLRRSGDFILRRLKHGKIEGFVVSVRWSEVVKHVPILTHRGRYSFEDKSFRHISELITHHINFGIPLTHASGIRLERPKNRQIWELLTKDVVPGKVVGKGNFGQVYEGRWVKCPGQVLTVAIKTLDKMFRLKEEEIEKARVEMLEEARIMRAVSGQENVISVYGVTIDTEHPMAVMEMVKGGSLEKLLRRDKLPHDTKLRLAMEAARGIAGIHQTGHIHRDIAARNCLVTEDGGRVGTLLITDFGMSKHVGDKTQQYKPDTVYQMPVVWSSYESLKYFVWTMASDVWSLGVLVWEIFADGAQPYNDLEPDQTTKAGLVKHIEAGNRLVLPDDTPPDIVKLIPRCWVLEPHKRPEAADLCDSIKLVLQGDYSKSS